MIDVWSNTALESWRFPTNGEITSAGTRGPSRWKAGSAWSSSAAGGGTWS